MKKIQVLVIPADLEVEVETMEIYAGDISSMQGIVGGLFQALDLAQQKASLFANDEGKILQLPKNQRATMLLWMSGSRWRFQDFIAGNAFLIGLPDDEGDSGSVPTELVNLLFKTDSYKIEITTHNDESSWASNGLVFDNYWEAAHCVLDLASRWNSVKETRVVAA